MSPFVATPDFDTPILSARQINTLASWQAYLHAQGKLCRFPQRVFDNTATSGTDSWVEVWHGKLHHRHDANYTEYLYYDISITKDEATANSVFVRLFYQNITPGTPANALVELEQSSVGTTRTRDRIALADIPTAETHPADGDPVEIAVYAYRSSDASPASCACTVYWIEEIQYPDNYTALDDATALVDTEDEDVPTDLDLLAGNCEELDWLAGAYVPGFRSVELDGAGQGFTSATMAIWRWYTSISGRMYYRVALWKLAGGANTEVQIKFYCNTDTLMKTVSLKGGLETGKFKEDPYIETGYFALTGFAPAAEQNAGIRVHAVLEVTGNAEGGGIVYYLAEDGPTRSFLTADMIPAAHLAQVNGDAGTCQLRDLWDNHLLLAGDDGTGYGEDGLDVAGGMPAGAAILASRNQVMHVGKCDHLPRIPPGQYSIINIEGKTYQVVWLKRLLNHDYLYYRTKGGELSYIGPDGEEATEGLDDYNDDADEGDVEKFQVFDLSGIPDLIHGRYFQVRVLMDDKDNVLDYAYLGML